MTMLRQLECSVPGKLMFLCVCAFVLVADLQGTPDGENVTGSDVPTLEGYKGSKIRGPQPIQLSKWGAVNSGQLKSNTYENTDFRNAIWAELGFEGPPFLKAAGVSRHYIEPLLAAIPEQVIRTKQEALARHVRSLDAGLPSSDLSASPSFAVTFCILFPNHFYNLGGRGYLRAEPMLSCARYTVNPPCPDCRRPS